MAIISRTYDQKIYNFIHQFRNKVKATKMQKDSEKNMAHLDSGSELLNGQRIQKRVKANQRPTYIMSIENRYPFQKSQMQSNFNLKLRRILIGRSQSQQIFFGKNHVASFKKENPENPHRINLVNKIMIDYSKIRPSSPFRRRKSQEEDKRIQKLGEIVQKMQKIDSYNLISFEIDDCEQNYNKSENVMFLLNYQTVHESLSKYVSGLPSISHAQYFLNEVYRTIKELMLQLSGNGINLPVPEIENIGVASKEEIRSSVSGRFSSQADSYSYAQIKIYIDIESCQIKGVDSQNRTEIEQDIDRRVENQCLNRLISLLKEFAHGFYEKNPDLKYLSESEEGLSLDSFLLQQNEDTIESGKLIETISRKKTLENNKENKENLRYQSVQSKFVNCQTKESYYKSKSTLKRIISAAETEQVSQISLPIDSNEALLSSSKSILFHKKNLLSKSVSIDQLNLSTISMLSIESLRFKDHIDSLVNRSRNLLTNFRSKYNLRKTVENIQRKHENNVLSELRDRQYNSKSMNF